MIAELPDASVRHASEFVRDAGMKPRESRILRVATWTAVAAIVFIVARHLFSIYGVLYREFDADEAEMLHVGWLMRAGLRLYRDFCENHPPFLFTILKGLVPRPFDLASYVARARLFVAVCGLLAVGVAATVTYRISRNVVAPLITIAVLIASPWFWYRALADVRNDPPTLLLFWLGALFILGPWRSERMRLALAGIGIGFIGIVALWNPKWPLESIILGIFYVATLARARGLRNIAIATVPPALCVAAAFAWIWRQYRCATTFSSRSNTTRFSRSGSRDGQR